jgi:predicted Zn-dependent protease
MRGIFIPMKIWYGGFLVVAALVLGGCGGAQDKDACTKFFTPYPDLFANTERTVKNADLLDAMAKYRAGDYAGAEELLKAYVKRPASKDIALIYLASSQLAQGRPYDAELQLDHLEASKLKDMSDQTEWYTLLCWVCSEQHDRAVTEARRISEAGRHSYQREAQELLKMLEQ